MMSQGRCSATFATMMVLSLVVFHSNSKVADATTYFVGGTNGWTFNIESWTDGKRFKAGDILVFKYNPSYHNVVPVNRANYAKCSSPRGAKAYQTGSDQIKLVKGQNLFICSFAGHCQSGMKIAAIAI